MWPKFKRVVGGGPRDVRDDIFKSYVRLRWGLAGLALLFPIGLFVIGWAGYGIALQNSMSAYYFAQDPLDALKYSFPLRVWFVGVLWALGTFLYFYKGFSGTENFFLNIAGISAIVVAVVPMAVDPLKCPGCGDGSWVHGAAAIVLFVSISIVAWACTDETLVMLSGRKRKVLRRLYSGLAALMLVLPIAVYVWSCVTKDPHGIYVAELVCIGAFAMYWATKTYELDFLQTQKARLLGPPLSPPPPTGDPAQATDDGGQKSAFLTWVDGARHRVGRMLD